MKGHRHPPRTIFFLFRAQDTNGRRHVHTENEALSLSLSPSPPPPPLSPNIYVGVRPIMSGSETRSPFPFPFRRRSSGDVTKNLASVSSSLLPAFGTVVDDGYLHLKKYVIAPYDRRYR
jgi:hypothetical protein